MLSVAIVTLFPEMFSALNYGITGRALKNNLIQISFWNPRDYTHDRHRTVDDKPYGGGPGMVMKVKPLLDAILSAKQALNVDTKVISLSPQGQRLDQRRARELTSRGSLILVAGRYEGIDERLYQLAIDEEISIGDYVLSGGEFAAMVLVDAMVRLLPGALGDELSALQDSFVAGLLDYPHYTRPEEIAGLNVPEVLISGDHQAIERWRKKQALGKTWLKRPDLLANMELTSEQQRLLAEFISEYTEKS